MAHNKLKKIWSAFYTIYLRGQCYAVQNKFKEAISDFTKLIQADPNSFEIFHLRGQCNDRLKNYSEAISDFTRVI